MPSQPQNDPGGVQALLAKLRSLQDRVTDTDPNQCTQSGHLRPWAVSSRPLPAYLRRSGALASGTSHPLALSKQQQASPRDIENEQAVKHTLMLCEDASFLKAFGKLQTEQDALELALAKERTALVGKDEENLRGPNGARTQAAYAHWTWEALRRWNQLRYSQQQQLEQLGVPWFYDTNDPAALERQYRLLTVLLERTRDIPK